MFFGLWLLAQPCQQFMFLLYRQTTPLCFLCRILLQLLQLYQVFVQIYLRKFGLQEGSSFFARALILSDHLFPKGSPLCPTYHIISNFVNFFSKFESHVLDYFFGGILFGWAHICQFVERIQLLLYFPLDSSIYTLLFLLRFQSKETRSNRLISWSSLQKTQLDLHLLLKAFFFVVILVFGILRHLSTPKVFVFLRVKCLFPFPCGEVLPVLATDTRIAISTLPFKHFR